MSVSALRRSCIRAISAPMFPSNKQLIASSHSTEEIRQQIGADSLGYMPIEELQNMVGDLPICRACFDSHYPMEVPKQDISALLESLILFRPPYRADTASGKGAFVSCIL